MNQENLSVFKSVLKVADVHAARLNMAMEHIKKLQPLTTEKLEHLTDEELSFLDVITGRFAKLQDLIGSKVFPLLLDLMQESTPSMSAIDRFNKLEKLNLLPNASVWINLRETRNIVTHEYPDDNLTMINNLKTILKDALYLHNYWTDLRNKIDLEIKKFEKLNQH